MSTKANIRDAVGLKWITILLVLCAATFGAMWGVYKIPTQIVDRMLETDIRDEAKTWKRRVLMHMRDLEGTISRGTVSETDADFLLLFPQASEVFRFKFYDNQGRVFWSNRNSDIGTYTTESFFRHIVAQGQIHYSQRSVSLTEIDGLPPIDGLPSQNAVRREIEKREVAEVYVPILRNGRFIGAVQFHSDITDVRDSFITRVRLLMIAFCAVALAAAATISWVIYRNNRYQLSAVKARNTKERDLMTEQLRLAREVRLLGELNEWLQSSRSLGELFEMVASFMTKILPEAEGSIYIYSNSRDVLDGMSSWNGGTHKPHIHPDGCWGLRRGRAYEFGASEIEFVCEHAEPHDGRPYFCFPILAHGETVGLMHLRAVDGSTEAFKEHKKLAQMCAEHISMAIANVRMRDQLQDQSVRDPLTGLFNRRHMTDYLRKAIARNQDQGTMLSMIAIDVDHFKKFNDNHGHDAGDMVLRAVGALLEQACDGDEIACRMGGEEFTLILPETTQEDTLTRAEDLRQAVEAVAVRYGEKTLPRITISLGVAYCPAHGTMPQDLMRAADEALYDAKARGRNQLRIAAHASATNKQMDTKTNTSEQSPEAHFDQDEKIGPPAPPQAAA